MMVPTFFKNKYHSQLSSTQQWNKACY